MRILTILFGPKLGYVESYDKKCVAIPEPLEFAAEGAARVVFGDGQGNRE